MEAGQDLFVLQYAFKDGEGHWYLEFAVQEIILETLKINTLE